jgi:hypothetical protein
MTKDYGLAVLINSLVFLLISAAGASRMVPVAGAS